MDRTAVGVTGKLWRKVTVAEREGYREMAEEGYSLRDIGLKFGRDHHVVAYNLKEDKDRLLASAKARERRREKHRKPVAEVRLVQKLNVCLHQARKRAETKRLPIDIDIRFLLDLHKEQHGCCALTGIEMEVIPMPGLRINPYSVSLDRIDNDMGYTRENVRLVTWCINCALGEWGEHHFEEIIKTYLWKKYGPRSANLFSP